MNCCMNDDVIHRTNDTIKLHSFTMNGKIGKRLSSLSLEADFTIYSMCSYTAKWIMDLHLAATADNVYIPVTGQTNSNLDTLETEWICSLLSYVLQFSCIYTTEDCVEWIVMHRTRISYYNKYAFLLVHTKAYESGFSSKFLTTKMRACKLCRKIHCKWLPWHWLLFMDTTQLLCL